MSDEKKYYKLSDNVIIMVRELLQLSILTGFNIVDNLRSMVLVSENGSTQLQVSEEFVKEHNKMVKNLTEEAEKRSKEYFAAQELKSDDSKN